MAVLTILIFSFSRIARSQAVETHHHLLTKTADLLARSAMEIVVSRLGSGFEDTLLREAAALYEPSRTPGQPISVGETLADELRRDLNVFFGQCEEIHPLPGLDREPPTCTQVKIEFQPKQPLIPNFQAGLARDPVEKWGEFTVSCSVSYHGLTRQGTAGRRFFLVSMVPGPYCRFTLFAPFTPWEFSYNALGVDSAGNVDTTYVHPWPRPIAFSGPLILKNATSPQAVPAPDDARDLENHGWVFLGPAPKKGESTRSEPVFLKLPEGYHPVTGGNFHYKLPPLEVGPQKIQVLPPERVVDPENLVSPEEKGFSEFSWGTRYQGFFTNYMGDRAGAHSLLLWDVLTGPRWLCASSWLMPYGNGEFPSRTLIVGPVLAGYLKLYFIKGQFPDGKKYAGIIRGVPVQEAYDSRKRIDTIPQYVLPVDFLYNSLFKKPTTTPIGWDSFQKVYPYSSIPHPRKMGPLEHPVAFNRYFDFMKYEAGTNPDKPLPPMDEQPSLAGTVYDDKPRCVPCASRMRTPQLAQVKGLHPSENVKIMLPKRKGVPDTDNDAIFFHGSLKEYDIQNHKKEGLYYRVTHVIDLSEIDPGKEQARFQDEVFRPATPDDPCPAGSWIPKRSGIIAVLRRTAGDLPPLEFPGKIFVNRSMVLLIPKGDVVIPATITTGTPPRLQNLFSLILAGGDIRLGPEVEEIHGYLAALRPGPGFQAGGGRILSVAPPHPKPLAIVGGLAAWEMGLYYEAGQDPRSVGTTMEHFPQGGTITYNGYLNPASPLYHRSLTLIYEDQPWTVTFSGGS